MFARIQLLLFIFFVLITIQQKSHALQNADSEIRSIDVISLYDKRLKEADSKAALST
jgi:hypothetical protein